MYVDQLSVCWVAGPGRADAISLPIEYSDRGALFGLDPCFPLSGVEANPARERSLHGTLPDLSKDRH